MRSLPFACTSCPFPLRNFCEKDVHVHELYVKKKEEEEEEEEKQTLTNKDAEEEL